MDGLARQLGMHLLLPGRLRALRMLLLGPL
jgi:hypothetical protein